MYLNRWIKDILHKYYLTPFDYTAISFFAKTQMLLLLHIVTYIFTHIYAYI